MNFISVDELKSRLEVSEIIIFRNELTDKLSVNYNGDKYLKCQQDIDITGKKAYMFEDDFTDGCLINVKESNNNVLIVL